MEHHASAFSMMLTELLHLPRHMWAGYGSHPMSLLERYDHLLLTVFAALLVIGFTSAMRKRLSIVPGPMQSLFESYYHLVEGLAKGAIAKGHERYIPLIGTLGLLILVNNALGMVPFFGTGNSNLNVTVACAILVFLVYNIEGTRVNGIHYWTHLAGPANNPFMVFLGIALIFPLEFLGLFIRIFSHSMRLFLNMALEHIVSTAFFSVVPLVLPVPVMFLGFITVLVQALVFITLAAVYIGGAVMEMHHEDHGHDGHGHAAHAH